MNPADVREEPGQGIVGVVDGRRVAVGSGHWLRSLGYPAADLSGGALDGSGDAGLARVHVGADGRVPGPS